MKLVRTLLIFGLAISIVLNFMLYWRNERLKSQFEVNGHKFTKRDYHDWLEHHYGLQTQANMIKYYLVTDAAKKAGVMPGTAEIDQTVKDALEANPAVAAKIKNEPWLRDDLVQNAELQLAMLNLTTNGAKLTDDQLKSTYDTFGPAAFDTPAKVQVVVLFGKDSDRGKRTEYVQRAKDLVDSMAARAKVETPTPGVQGKPLPDISMVGQQLAPHIDGGPQIYQSNQPQFALVNGLRVGESKVLPIDKNGPFLFYVEKREEGRKSSLSDPATRRNVVLRYKMMQGGGKLLDQKLRELWDASTIKTDPESQKADIQHILFPNRPEGNPAQ
jgi:hypothetical protein